MGLIVTLILVGLVLLCVEMLLRPGVGVSGILGLCSLGGACFYAFHELGTLAGGIVTGITGLLIIFLVIYVLRAKTWKRMSLETNIDTKATDDESSYVCVGDKGMAVSRLAPVGTVRFGGRVVEAKALEGMIDPGTEVEVVLIEDGRICVCEKFEDQ